jgi:hypothetical protein
VASEFLFRLFRDRFVNFQRVIVKKFFAGLDITDRIDEDAVVFLDGFAVWVAGMIDPTRVVAANLWIDYLPVFQAKIECVWIVLVVRSSFPRNTLARVFDNASAFWNELHSVNAATVHAGVANFDLYASLSGVPLLRHVQWRIKQEEKARKQELRIGKRDG